MRKVLSLPQWLIIISPSFIALHSVSFYYASNRSEITELNNAVQTVIIAALLSAAIIALSRLVFRDLHKTTILAGVVIFIVFSYGHIFNLLFSLKPYHYLDRVLLLACITIIIILTIILRRIRTIPTLLFNSLVIIVLFITISSVVSAVNSEMEVRKHSLDARVNALIKSKKISLNSEGEKPDIYYLVFDKYSGNRTIKQLYHYDNEQFLKSLEERGFFVAKDSTANYPATFPSLTSTLNLEFLPTLKEEVASDIEYPSLKPFLDHNRVALSLQNYGYTYHHVGSWWQFTRSNQHANKSYFHGDQLALPLYTRRYLIKTTVFGPFLKKYYSDDYVGIVEKQLSALTSVAQSVAGPKFVFAHVITPHPPYGVDQKCRRIPLVEDDHPDGEELLYTNQLQCVNRHILDLVDTIQKEAKRPTIIVLQADEGMDLKVRQHSSDKSEAVKENVFIEEKFPILNAIYFSNKDYSKLYPSISSVNTFRLILSQYLGAKLDLYPDKNFLFSDYYTISNFTDVTDKVKTLYK